MPENNNSNNKANMHDTGADKSTSKNKLSDLKEAYGAYREANNVNKASNINRNGVVSNNNHKKNLMADNSSIGKNIDSKIIDNFPQKNFIRNNIKNVNPINNNYGKRILNNIGNRVKPNSSDDNGKANAEKIKKLTSIAKRIPIPQVQAAAKAIDAANKSGMTDKIMSKNKNNEDNNSTDPFRISGSFTRNKIMIIGMASLFIIIIFSSIFFGFSNSSSAANAGSVNEGLCVVDNDNNENNEECEEQSEDAKNFYKIVKTVNNEFSANGKYFNSVYISGFYFSVSSFNGSDIDYNSMTKDKIEEIVNAMFKEDGTTFDEDTFRKNLKEKILPNYFSHNSNVNYDAVIARIFEYVDNFKDIYGEGDTGTAGVSMGDKLVQVAISQLDDGNSSKYHGEKYWRYMGFSSYVYWCASFVSWCANEAGISQDVIIHSASVNSFYDYYVKQGNFHSINSGYIPKAGDLIIWKSGSNAKGWSHIGIVEKYDTKTGKLYTLEGNSSDSVARNVYSNLGDCTGFASPNYPIIDESDSIVNGQTIFLPSGLGTYATREFDLAVTDSEISYSRYMIRTYKKITNPYAFPESSAQRIVQNMWISSGAKHDNKGFCKLNGRYLIAMTSTFGNIGDKVDVYISNGKVIHAILADAKNMKDDRANKWGHEYGQVVLEFIGKNSIGDNPYNALGITENVTVVKAINGNTILK